MGLLTAAPFSLSQITGGAFLPCVAGPWKCAMVAGPERPLWFTSHVSTRAVRASRAAPARINAKVIAAQAQQQPVISVDTKKKELIGNFKNGGTDYRPKGAPLRVNVHDFEDKKLGKVVPYGVYDMSANAGFVSVGITASSRNTRHGVVEVVQKHC